MELSSQEINPEYCRSIILDKIFNRVDFPDPFGPIKPNTSPVFKLNEILFSIFEFLIHLMKFFLKHNPMVLTSREYDNFHLIIYN